MSIKVTADSILIHPMNLAIKQKKDSHTHIAELKILKTICGFTEKHKC